MRVMVFGVMSMQGKSAKTGMAYNMARLYVASDLTNKATEAYKRRGAGFEAAEVDLEESAVDAFLGLTYPAILTLETSMRMQGGKLAPVVTGLIQEKARAAA